jgi:hypothetical protein
MAWERSHRKRFGGRRSDVETIIAMTIIEAVGISIAPPPNPDWAAIATSGDHRIFPRIVDKADSVPPQSASLSTVAPPPREPLIDEP